MKRKLSIFLSLITIMLMIFFVGDENLVANAAELKTIDGVAVSYTPNPILYEYLDATPYELDDTKKVNTMTFGRKTVGELKINGEGLETGNYSGTQALGSSGNLSFSYEYDGSLDEGKSDPWYISADAEYNVIGVELSGMVWNGAFFIQKSTDNKNWSLVGNPVVDFFTDFNTKPEVLYTTDGKDLAKGVYYRVVVAYETAGWIDNVKYYNRHLELYNFFACINNAQISIHNLSVDPDSIKSDGLTIEAQTKGETLLDGSTTLNGFSIDKLGIDNKVEIETNGKKTLAADGEKFTEPGKYKVTTTTKLGKQNIQTIYIIGKSDDRDFSVYFGDYILDGERIFKEGDYPSYNSASKIHIKGIPDDKPPVNGTIENLDTKEIQNIDPKTEEQVITLPLGSYHVTLYNGNPNSGSMYKYDFFFNIIDEVSNPKINYSNLMSTERICDFKAKHYEVAYVTNMGGYVYVCFSAESYQEAFDYAYEIEGRFIEKTEDGGYYYKSPNSDQKVKYFDLVELTKERNIRARRNVEWNYFNTIDPYTYRTLDASELKDLESLNIRDSIKVFPSEEEKQKMIKRQPFINDFTFIQAADYEVEKVEAYCFKNGKTYNIDFGIDVSKQLTVTSKYRIIETNKYGKTNVYEAYYENENQTRSVWSYTLNGITKDIDVNSSLLVDNEIILNADSIVLKSITNAFDSSSIVTIKAPNVYSFEIKCMIEELKDVAFYKKGRYEITFVDRVGNSYKFIVILSGLQRYSEVIVDKVVSYTGIYNNIYLNPRTTNEEVIVNATDLKDAINRKVNQNIYTNISFTNYTTFLNAAVDVYNNPYSTQEEIDKALLDLNNAYSKLEKTIDKTILGQELSLFEIADKSIYTSQSYRAWSEGYFEAKKVYFNDKVTYDDLNNAASSLKTLRENLKFRGNKDELIDVLDKTRGIDCSKYTPNSIEELNEAYLEGEKVLNNIDSIQEQIDSVIALISTSTKNLIPRANFDELYFLILTIKELDKSLYTKVTVDDMYVKYNEAIDVYKDQNSNQETINAALYALNLTYTTLENAGDATELKALLDNIKNMSKILYSNEDVEILNTEYNMAISIIENRDSQALMDSIIEDLNSTLETMKPYSKRVELYDEIENSNKALDNYLSKTTKKRFIKTYNKAVDTLNSETASDAELENAKAELQKMVDHIETGKGLEWWHWMFVSIAILVFLIIVIAVLFG